jgi:3,4-dihydroxy-2-butanone 4-phosphate synthase
LRASAVMCEFCRSDGLNMARRDELVHLARDSGIPIVTIDELIELRQKESRQQALVAG